jgi:hypothetical protein
MRRISTSPICLSQSFLCRTSGSSQRRRGIPQKNTTATETRLRYRRVMDWDIEPTAFQEYVPIKKGNSPNVIFTSDDGSATADLVLNFGQAPHKTGCRVPVLVAESIRLVRANFSWHPTTGETRRGTSLRAEVRPDAVGRSFDGRG